MIGNFIADAVKGKQYNSFAPEIARGILLHRKIDSYTDSHPIVDLSKQRLRPTYHKYSTVIIDILYDHYLAVNWKEYSDVPLPEYALNIYSVVKKYENILPQKSQLFMNYMIQDDILNAYAHLKGLEKVLIGMSHRTRFESNMNLAINEIKEHYNLFEAEFKAFFPHLQKHLKLDLSLP